MIKLTTLQAQYVAILLHGGEREVKSLRGCRVFTRAAGGYFYLGNRGSFRFGTSRSTSIPVSKRLVNELMAAYRTGKSDGQNHKD